MLVDHARPSGGEYPGFAVSSTGSGAFRKFLSSTGYCRSQRELVGMALDHLADIFGANCSAVLLVDAQGATTSAAFSGITEPSYDAYEKYWRPIDKVLRAVLERQIPVHGAQIEGDDIRRASPIYLDYARPLGLYHYLSAPIYGVGGRLAGVFNVCRPEHHRVFGNGELALASAVAGHLSTNLERLSHQQAAEVLAPPVQLAPREREVARLAAHGSNNQQIASSLNVARETVKKTLRRVYFKLDVNGRAQMVARLAELGWL